MNARPKRTLSRQRTFANLRNWLQRQQKLGAGPASDVVRCIETFQAKAVDLLKADVGLRLTGNDRSVGVPSLHIDLICPGGREYERWMGSTLYGTFISVVAQPLTDCLLVGLSLVADVPDRRPGVHIGDIDLGTRRWHQLLNQAIEPGSVTYMENEPVWAPQAIMSARRLLSMPENWDGSGARPIVADAMEQALSLLEDTIPENAPLPVLVPSPAGGVQLEWHLRGIDIEAEVSPESEFSLYIERDDKTELEVAGARTRIEGLLSRALAELVPSVVGPGSVSES